MLINVSTGFKMIVIQNREEQLEEEKEAQPHLLLKYSDFHFILFVVLIEDCGLIWFGMVKC